jgi:RNA polymerase-interacting CarD/CdnL/TRCF family regulator
MHKLTPTYSLGDKIVHRSYGVGQIAEIEWRPFEGVKVECFRVRTENGSYWFPISGPENPRIHPLASQELIREAIKILQSAPKGLEFDILEWNERIQDVVRNGDFLATSSLVRDLSALKTRKKLNRTQEQALANLEERLLVEWSASMGVEVRTIRTKLKAYLGKASKTG